MLQKVKFELTRCEVEALLEISSEMKNKKSLKNVTITADYDIILPVQN